MNNLLLAAAGGAAGSGPIGTNNEFFAVYKVPRNTTGGALTTIPLPKEGYSGLITLWLAGESTLMGGEYDGVQGCSASGETGKFDYQFIGDETHLELQTFGSSSVTSSCRLTIRGGVNNGRFCTVGSGGPYNPNYYGAAAPPPSYINSSDSVFLRDTSLGGAWAYRFSTEYTDNTSFPAAGSGYGVATSITQSRYFQNAAKSSSIIYGGSSDDTRLGGFTYNWTGQSTGYIGKASSYYGLAGSLNPEGQAGVIIFWR